MRLNHVVLGLAQADKNYGFVRKKNAEDFSKIFSTALNLGIKNFDTAPNYKNSDKLIKKINYKKKYTISTKLPIIECSLKDFPNEVKKQIDAIFIKNQIKKIENFFLHDPLIVLDSERWKILKKILHNLKKRGLIKNIGVSVYNKYETDNILKVFTPDILQFPHNVFNQSFDEEYLGNLKKKKIKLQARSIFLQGVLCQKSNKGYFFQWKENFQLWRKYLKKNKKKAFEECLSFVISSKHIDSFVIGSESINNIKDVVNFFNNKKKKINRSEYKIFKSNDEYLIDPRLWRKALNKTQKKWWTRCKYVLNGGMLLSKNPDQFLPGKWPISYIKAKGCKIWIDKKNFFYDFSLMGVGTNILGYANNKVNSFVKKIIDLSSNSTINSDLDVQLSKKILSTNKWASKCFFARTGGEANTIALRISRCFTKKNLVAICGYHGWHDWYLSTNLQNKKNLNNLHLSGLEPLGVNKNLKKITFPFKYNDIESFKRLIKSQKNIGTVFMEVQRNVKPKNNFLKKIREITTKKNIVLIFDECTSGFREVYGGLHKKFGVNPDLAVYGKAIGNGFPITAVVGREEVMKSAYNSFISSTFWSERLGPAAAVATLDEMKRVKSWLKIISIGKKIKKYWYSLGKKYNVKISITGLNSMPSLNFISKKNLYYKTYLTQELLKKKILSSNVIYCSVSHEKYLKIYFREFKKLFEKISRFEKGYNVLGYLEHPLARPGFQRLN
jgi:glutamate-1-semialdehyde aminotransferase/aryl-alcohol dehydrogenase-like predicted oxidoreductase